MLLAFIFCLALALAASRPTPRIVSNSSDTVTKDIAEQTSRVIVSSDHLPVADPPSGEKVSEVAA
jgi:hypothetical protein